jgi:hypothetical protein
MAWHQSMDIQRRSGAFPAAYHEVKKLTIFQTPPLYEMKNSATFEVS